MPLHRSGDAAEFESLAKSRLDSRPDKRPGSWACLVFVFITNAARVAILALECEIVLQSVLHS